MNSLRFYSLIHRACDVICAGLHRTERHVQRLRAWAWVRATRANLASCNTRIVARS